MSSIKNEKKADPTTELLKKLEDGLSDLFTSGKYQQYLTTMQKFHNYSYRNIMAIFMQKPEAIYVAGFKSWRTNFNRHVNKGEKAITIIAPTFFKTEVPVKDEKGNETFEEVLIPKFRAAYVFDVSQTGGEPLPEITKKLTGDVVDFETKLKVFKEVAPCLVRFDVMREHGCYSPTSKEIVIKQGLSEEQTIKTLIHEIAHAMLDHHQSNHTSELEAESVAFVVSNYFGVDSSQYSFGYIAGWTKTKDTEQLKNSLDVIQKTANELISKVDKALELVQEQKIEKTQSRAKEMSR